MGNCLLGALGESDGAVIKVIKSDGGVLEFYAPMTVGCIACEFPGHAIFPSRDLFWKPLCHSEELIPGRSYYLLPVSTDTDEIVGSVVRNGHVRSKSIPATSSLMTPYRMSLDCNPTVLKRSYTDVFSRYCNNNQRENGKNNKNKRFKSNGFWKVKLVISPEHLVEMLSEDGSTQELIESVRAVAKCGNGGVSSSSSSSSVAFSDQWSLSSSRNAASKKDLLSADI